MNGRIGSCRFVNVDGEKLCLRSRQMVSCNLGIFSTQTMCMYLCIWLFIQCLISMYLVIYLYIYVSGYLSSPFERTSLGHKELLRWRLQLILCFTDSWILQMFYMEPVSDWLLFKVLQLFTEFETCISFIEESWQYWHYCYNEEPFQLFLLLSYIGDLMTSASILCI